MILDFTKPFKAQYKFELPDAYLGGTVVLDLSNNTLSNQTAEEVALAFKAIPQNVHTLRLCSCQLGTFSVTDLALIFSSIPPNITHLDLSVNDLAYVDDLPLALATLPDTITKLSLWANGLCALSEVRLSAVFRSIKTSVQELNISGNGLGMFTQAAFKTPESLLIAFANLSVGIKSLDISGNFFEDVPKEYWVKLLTMLPPTVTEIIAYDTQNINMHDDGYHEDAEIQSYIDRLLLEGKRKTFEAFQIGAASLLPSLVNLITGYAGRPSFWSSSRSIPSTEDKAALPKTPPSR